MLVGHVVVAAGVALGHAWRTAAPNDRAVADRSALLRVGLWTGYTTPVELLRRRFGLGLLVGATWTRWARTDVEVTPDSAAVTRVDRTTRELALSTALDLDAGRLRMSAGLDLAWPDEAVALTLWARVTIVFF